MGMRQRERGWGQLEIRGLTLLCAEVTWGDGRVTEFLLPVIYL